MKLTDINPDANTNFETTITIDEGNLYIRHDSLESRLDTLEREKAGIWLDEPTLKDAWTVGLVMPGYTLRNYETASTLAAALAAILSRYGRCKAAMYLEPVPVRTSSPAAALQGLTEDQYADACIKAIDGPTGRRF